MDLGVYVKPYIHLIVKYKMILLEVFLIMSYSVTINTGAYKPRRCSKKNWEPGTLNNYMEALNGWSSVEPTLREVKWRIQLFCGQDAYADDGWETWYKQPHNTIEYYDKLCGFPRKQTVSGYGFLQGYFNIDNVLTKLEIDGTIKIPFKWLYDTRQYLRNMDGCYMQITKMVKTQEPPAPKHPDILQAIRKEASDTLVAPQIWEAFMKGYHNKQFTPRDIDLYILGEFKKCYNAIVHEFDFASVRHGWNDIFKKEYIHQKIVAQGNQVTFQGLVKTGYVGVSGTGYTFQHAKISLTQDQIERLAYIHRVLNTYLKA